MEGRLGLFWQMRQNVHRLGFLFGSCIKMYVLHFERGFFFAFFSSPREEKRSLGCSIKSRHACQSSTLVPPTLRLNAVSSKRSKSYFIERAAGCLL